jgi:hypothetical protein
MAFEEWISVALSSDTAIPDTAAHSSQMDQNLHNEE